MKSIIIAALLGAMTFDDVNALKVDQKGPVPSLAEHTATAAVKTAAKDVEAENKAVIKAQAGAEQAESRAAEKQNEILTKQIEQRIAAESKIKINKGGVELTPEQKEEALQKKITEEIKARKAVIDEALEKSKIKFAADAAATEARYKRMHEERKATIAGIEAETARLAADERAIAQKASQVRRNLTDEEWVANLPEHHLRGYVGVEDDVEEHDDDEDVDSDGDDDDLIGVHDDDVYADEDAAADANDDDDAGDFNQEDSGEFFGDEEATQGPASFAQKPSGHLHKTSIRVDPPLTADGKKSIKEAEKALEEAKREFDILKEKAQDLEFKFKSAARISRHAREQKGESEDAYYIAAKNARKSARHAENLAREAQQAAAKQAAHDKYNEVISAANSAASAATPPAGQFAITNPPKVAQITTPAPAAPAPATTPAKK